jgi:pyruvate dehydrogenase E2 component (dihydrolipoamide acetyltransferase)
MPALGAGMDVGTIIEWYVAPGDAVRRGSIIALVETDKANIDVEVFEDGVVEALLIEEGTKVPVGTPLARIGTGAVVGAAGAPVAPDVVPVAAPDAPTAAPAAAPIPVAVPDVSVPDVSVPEEPVEPHPIVLSPLVRRQAHATGVDLTRVHGTGPGGVVTRRDVAAAAAAVGTAAPRTPESRRPPSAERAPVTARAPARLPAAEGTGVRSSPYARRLAAEQGLALGELGGTGPGGALLARDIVVAPSTAPDTPTAPAAPAAPAAPVDGGDDRARSMRLAIARAMERSNREIPHYHLGETVDAEPLLGWLAERNAELPPAERLLPAAAVLKATALALRRFPDLNGYWIDDGFQQGEGIHLGVAINLRRGGLLAPAIRDADQLPLEDLMATLKDLVERTRSGGLRGSELTDPTITVSNLGDTGVESIHGVITPPQVAFVGVGRITERPWTIDGMLTVRRTVVLSLAGDHRASDGHRGARFLGAIATNLGRPEKL